MTAITHPEMTKEAARDLTNQINEASEDLAHMLQTAHDNGAYTALGYETWRAYVKAELKFSERRSFQLLDFAEIQDQLAQGVNICSLASVDLQPLTPTIPPITEAAARELKPVAAENRAAVYAEAVDESGGETPTAATVKRAAAKVAKPPEQEPFEGELAEAFTVLQTNLGKGFVKAIKDGVYQMMNNNDVMALAKLDVDQQKQLEPLLAIHWTLKKATKFLSRIPDDDTKIGELKNLCIAGGGKWDGMFNGFQVTIERVHRK